MVLTCPHCSRPFGASDVDFSSGAAKCRPCDSVFVFDRNGVGTGELIEGDVEGIRVKTDERGVVIAFRWSQGFKRLIVAVSAAVGLLFSCVSGWLLLSADASDGDVIRYTVMLVLGTLPLYWGLAQLFNQTRISANPSRISINNGPFPWRRSRRISATELSGLYCHRYGSDRHGEVLFSVVAVLGGPRRVPLVKGLRSHRQALKIRQEIERASSLKSPGSAFARRFSISAR